MIADTLLARLEGVKATGHNRWIAKCPSHKDRRPSLSIRVADDDKLLLKCHAECKTADVVGAIGLDLADLFPPRQVGIHSSRPRASALTPLIRAFETDLLIVHVFLADIGNGKPISATDRLTAKAAAQRIWSALREARHVH